MSTRALILRPSLGCICALLLSACGNDPPRGELMLSVTTDLAVPSDIDQLTLSVTLEGDSTPYAIKNLALSQGTDLPATLAIESGTGPMPPITVRVEGRKGSSPSTLRVVREARVAVPKDRVARLDMALSWLCSDTNLSEPCDPGSTCRAGHCFDSALEVGSLPDFQPAGASDCYDVTTCATSATHETPNPITLKSGEKIACGISGTNPLGPDADVNVLLLVNRERVGLDGFCNPKGECFIPLERSERPEGWQVVENGDTPTIRLPAAVCEHSPTSITQVAVVRASPDCPSARPDQPLCSPQGVPRCLEADVCPTSWPSGPDGPWTGYTCSGGAKVDDDPELLKCWSPEAPSPDGDTPTDGRWCCLRGQASSDDPLLIDDMSDGPQIKREPVAGQIAGWWFAEIPDGSGDLSPPPDPSVYTYRHFEPAQGSPGGPQFEAAACLSSQGFHGWTAIEGFFFSSRRGKYGSVPLDVSGYSGLSFWGWAQTPFVDGPQSVKVTFPNVQASTEPGSACISASSGTTRCDSFAKEVNLTGSWQRYFVPWSELTQSAQDWGQIYFGSFEPQVYAVTFGVEGAGPKVMSQPFDFCVADIRFEKELPP